MTGPETAELEAVDAALADRYVAPEHAELADLALLLRDDRPEPDPGWAAALDRRAQAGFPARPRRRRSWPGLRIGTGGVVATVVCSLLALVIAFAALAPRDSDEAGTAEPLSGGASVEVPEPDADGGAAGSAESSGAAGRGSSRASSEDPFLSGAPAPGTARGRDPSSDSRPNRSVERSAAITLAAPRRDIDGVASEAGRVAADLGGFVSQSSISSSDGGTLDLRVPSARLDDAIQRLSRLADVRELTRRSRDITSSVVSARERLNDARTERRSLLRQLADATTVNETESIRARLRIVSREIAAARARLRAVNNRAQFADIGVTLTPATARDEGAWTPGDALDDAARVLEVTAGVALVALAVALPLLLAGGAGWLARRGLTRRRRERALDMA
jgi:Domain of unknown function (DUF4349)